LTLTTQKKKDTSAPPNFVPHLLVQNVTGSEIGYLQLHADAPKIEIGPIDKKEFKIIKCLFSPENFLFARYSSTFQTTERVYNAMELAQGVANIPLQNLLVPAVEMRALIVSTIKNLQKREVGSFLRFEWMEDRVRMEIVAPF